MALFWSIQDGVNEGFPSLTTWNDTWQTKWSSGDGHRYPDNLWRIDGSTNDGFPWIYPWFKTNVVDTGDLIVGGTQSNYPSGLTPSNIGGIRDDFDDTSMINDDGGAYANAVITTALSGRAFVINGTMLEAILQHLNDDTIFDSRAEELISRLYGANIFDCFISCKIFPFDLTAITCYSWSASTGYMSVVSSNVGNVKAFGRYTIATGANLLASTLGFYQFPTINVRPLQAWEIENIDFSIYLPMSGTYPIDIRGESDIDIMMYVDLITGTGEYYVHINGQLIGIYRAMFGSDVPINTNQGRMQANMLTNIVSTVGRASGTLIGGAVGGLGGAVLGSTVGGLLGGVTEHYTSTNPAIGGLASMQCYPYPRVIAKIPKMFKDGFGFKETLGENRSTAYYQLAECSGFVRTKNYKTDIIVATDGEKAEIERLMDSGVFI